MWFWQTLGFQQEAMAELTLENLLAWGLVISVFFSGCVLFWRKLVRSWLQKDEGLLPVCFQRKRLDKPVMVPVVPVVLAGFWIAASIFQQYVPAREIEEIDINLLLVNQVANLFILTVFLLLSWEFSREQYRLLDYFQLAEWRTEVRAGFELFLLAMPCTLILMILSQLWKSPGDNHILLEYLQQNQGDFGVLLLISLTVVVMGPIFEELLYRVLLLNGLIQRGGVPVWIAVLVVSVVFCLGHGLKDTLQLLPLALCLGWCLVRRQSFVAIVVGHGLFNAFMLTMALLQSGNGS